MTEPNAQPEQPADLELRRLDPASLRFEMDGPTQSIRLSIQSDRDYPRIFAARAFPQTEPNRFIQIYDAKEDGTRGDAIGLVENLAPLDPDSRAALKESLRRSYLIPQVRAILDVRDDGFLTHWVIDTDRGEREFDLTQPHRNVIRAGADRVILIDSEENRYDIPTASGLDRSSLRLLERFI